MRNQNAANLLITLNKFKSSEHKIGKQDLPDVTMTKIEIHYTINYESSYSIIIF